MVNNQVVYAKLDNLQRCVARIESRLPEQLESFLDEWDIQDVVSLNLQRAVQACVDAGSHILAEEKDLTPNSMGQVFNFLAMRNVLSNEIAERLEKAVGLRNLLVHEYDMVDWERVFYSVKAGLTDFRKFAEELVYWMEQGEISEK